MDKQKKRRLKEKIKNYYVMPYVHGEFTDVLDSKDKLVARFYGGSWRVDDGRIYAGIFMRALQAQEDVLDKVFDLIDEKPKQV